jgi:hypothetical protein
MCSLAHHRREPASQTAFQSCPVNTLPRTLPSSCRTPGRPPSRGTTLARRCRRIWSPRRSAQRRRRGHTAVTPDTRPRLQLRMAGVTGLEPAASSPKTSEEGERPARAQKRRRVGSNRRQDRTRPLSPAVGSRFHDVGVVGWAVRLAGDPGGLRSRSASSREAQTPGRFQAAEEEPRPAGVGEQP